VFYPVSPMSRPASQVAPEYAQTVPVQVHLGLLRLRLRSGFYRHGAALLDDLDLMLLNCCEFDGYDAPIADAAAALVARLKRRAAKLLS
jgi:hypothetical protein